MATKPLVLHEMEAAVTAMPNPLAGCDVCGLADFTPAKVRAVLDLARDVKAQPELYHHALDRKQMVLFFEKSSLRTRLTFEVAIKTLGGDAMFVDQTQQRLGEREPLSDVAHNIERWCDVAVLRTYSHATVTELAQHAAIPVINALSDVEHPCQALADLLTLEEHLGPLAGRGIAYVGDGNNVAASLLLAAAHTGMHITLATPEGFAPDAKLVRQAQHIAASTGGSVRLTDDPRKAVMNAAAVYTDTWTSMGHEEESEHRKVIFAPYQVNSALMSLAELDALFLHCLPAYRGLEVTEEVLDGPQSVVFDQAENRLHVQKALLLLVLGAHLPARARAGKLTRRSHRG